MEILCSIPGGGNLRYNSLDELYDTIPGTDSVLNVSEEDDDSYCQSIEDILLEQGLYTEPGFYSNVENTWDGKGIPVLSIIYDPECRCIIRNATEPAHSSTVKPDVSEKTPEVITVGDLKVFRGEYNELWRYLITDPLCPLITNQNDFDCYARDFYEPEDTAEYVGNFMEFVRIYHNFFEEGSKTLDENGRPKKVNSKLIFSHGSLPLMFWDADKNHDATIELKERMIAMKVIFAFFHSQSSTPGNIKGTFVVPFDVGAVPIHSNILEGIKGCTSMNRERIDNALGFSGSGFSVGKAVDTKTLKSNQFRRAVKSTLCPGIEMYGMEDGKLLFLPPLGYDKKIRKIQPQ